MIKAYRISLIAMLLMLLAWGTKVDAFVPSSSSGRRQPVPGSLTNALKKILEKRQRYRSKGVVPVSAQGQDQDEAISSTYKDSDDSETRSTTSVKIDEEETTRTAFQTNEEQSPPEAPQQDQLRRQPPSSSPPMPSAQDLMRAMGTSPRRLFLGTASATGIALLGNFLGVTSQLLTLVPEDTVEATGFDTYFPRGDYKRVKGKGYSFVIPKEWVGDTFVELAKAQRLTKPLDYNMRQGGGRYTTLPDAAFGPPGRLNPRTGVSEEGDTNVSVIVADGLTGFSLKGTLGPPEEAAQKLIRLSLAPEGSGRTIQLRSAVEDASRQVYQLEYDVDRGERLAPLRAISVIAGGTNKLITMTVTAPKQAWETDATLAGKLERIASSFHATI